MLTSHEICTAWGLPPITAIDKPRTGTIHHVSLLTTEQGRYVLRAYRYAVEELFRVSDEHAIASFVRAHGLPAITPLPLIESGETCLEQGGRLYALYPFAVGEQISRGELSSGQCSDEIIPAMGRMLAEIQKVLITYPLNKVRPLSLEVDRRQTMAGIEEIERVIAAKKMLDKCDQKMLQKIQARKEYLSTAIDVDVSELAELPVQALHGDFQETNLFFADGHVSAVIDWDQARAAPRSWELLRTLHYVFDLEPHRCRTFLDAYQQVFPLSFAELQLTAKVYGWVQANNLWGWQEYYIQGNERMRALLETGDGEPFSVKWERIF